MKFDIKGAICHIFKDKNLALKFFVFCIFVLLALFLGIIRNFFTSELYYDFDDFSNRILLASANFTPYSLFQYLGFPMVATHLIPFDIGQLFLGSFHIVRLKATLAILFGTCLISFVTGYFLYYMYNLVLNKENELPELKNGLAYFKKGIQYFAACFILLVPILIVNLILVKFAYSYFNDGAHSDLSWLWAMIRPIVAIFCVWVLAVASFLYLSVLTLPYICTLQVKSLFKFKQALSFVFRNAKSYFKYLLHTFVFTLSFVVFTFVMIFLYELINEFGIFDFDIGDTSISVAASSFVAAFIVICISLPFLFWYISTITNLQAQFAKLFLDDLNSKTNEDDKRAKFHFTFKQLLICVGAIMLLVVLLFFAAIAIRYFFTLWFYLFG